jgi:short-subunit dehydrogenase
MEHETNRPVALITGAGRGIGRALSGELAKYQYDLVIVSLPGEQLEEYARELSEKHKINVHFCEMNLAEEGAPHRLHQWVKERNLTLSVLINNAGFGTQLPYQDSQYFLASSAMLRLNVQVPHDVIWLFLPDLLSQEKSYVLNTSSSAAFTIVPYKSAYAASKTFLLNFSRAIRYELRETSVKISVLCPGAVPTNDAVRARMEASGWMAKITSVSPEDVAAYTIRKMFAGKTVIIPGFSNRLSLWASRILPVDYSIRVMGKNFSKKVD